MKDDPQEVIEVKEISSHLRNFRYTEIFIRQGDKLYYTRSKIGLDELEDSGYPIFDINDRNVFYMHPSAYLAEWVDGITKYEGPDPPH